MKPGSDEALGAGCTCPVLDNRRGEGIPNPDGGENVHWMNDDCPLHGGFLKP